MKPRWHKSHTCKLTWSKYRNFIWESLSIGIVIKHYLGCMLSCCAISLIFLFAYIRRPFIIFSVMAGC